MRVKCLPYLPTGKMHGVGIFQFADGHRYEGGFKAGWMHGPATVTYPSKAIYQGHFFEGSINGEGEMGVSL
jgi:hypothetical protein